MMLDCNYHNPIHFFYKKKIVYARSPKQLYNIQHEDLTNPMHLRQTPFEIRGQGLTHTGIKRVQILGIFRITLV